MPNWATNELIIKGDLEERKDFADKMEENGFMAIVPLEEETISEAIFYWGTKWNLDGLSTDFYEEETVMMFMTAWSPPKQFILSASKKYPKLVFTLKTEEMGCFYMSQYKVAEGEVLEQKQANNLEDMKDKFGEDDFFATEIARAENDQCLFR